MRIKAIITLTFSLMICVLTQTVYGDIILDKTKDVVGPTKPDQNTLLWMVIIFAAIAVVWVISLNVIKSIRNKNVNK